ncbi:MAG: tRNA (adenosine(37)-N6)-threonylcarbamoyltransferase complex transferase subunit TsaD [Candidatus Terrybacteria bacterium RIFCSPHIGHO2_01_FULL_48_17]|uniref:tRNA N6-adenosine threonylcarbamoyltransferase n=1 Tax=Candidatus Terrybacteria bacterium RIFCSPHIGHO2_01_FULL_48_17 TaxID=1802362 RepID=A0A1G2PL36_9BACT|nr:MAG: tRNA (adenosine(37)-N6)-threonylcarbamoyltransferase complex transferase subunit TsaD [Candidatus Terrybacteria bacterium RIFCSPHIGHO2_01_FULL_48_17]OHA52680.1 MAG: tRNA (adenosine(37)-N6)-threonylcarbamoyltransferase complex transferase subunit TsaD [Candidatus Terrybacteria bacterium RIFCSPLOWO2_01_FULL_48_14]
MKILGIETSCDDTCAAIIKASGGIRRPKFKVLSNVVSSQVKVHQKYGGVVPTLAAREHAKNIKPVVKKAFQGTGYRVQDIDLIAVTTHPGLLPALLVGVHAARTIAWWLHKPILGINHLEAHLVANLLGDKKKQNTPNQSLRSGTGQARNKIQTLFPAVGLIVSGGHTQLVLMRDFGKMKIIGETRDDAAGEAFDKVAKMLGLPFPGGPPVAALAAKKQDTRSKIQISLPRPMIDSNDFDFSFSGLKTAVLYLLRDNPQIPKTDVAASFQQAVVDVLTAKTIRAAKKYKAKTVMLGGGVAANQELRRQLRSALTKLEPIPYTLYPIPSLALDNAAMIAATAYLHWLKGERNTWQQIKVRI